ncbi:MAG TPA: hypothetical protein VJ597_06330 [Sphingomicrobium sp.]|nr:hypothetical protein [Sphingomicrobium sp.]
MKTEKLQINLVKQGSGPGVWHMSHGSASTAPGSLSAASGGPGNYPKVHVPAKATADFEITIVSPGNITFSGDPIWIQKGTAKPTGGVDPQITNISGQGTPVLKFHDTNQTKGTLTYVLNFNNAPQLDPIIENGGGGIGDGGIDNYAVYYLVGAAVLAVLAIFVIRRMMAKPSRPQGPGEG